MKRLRSRKFTSLPALPWLRKEGAVIISEKRFHPHRGGDLPRALLLALILHGAFFFSLRRIPGRPPEPGIFFSARFQPAASRVISATGSKTSEINRPDSRPEARGGESEPREILENARLLNSSALADLLERYYPESRRRLREEGRVKLRLFISDQGEVSACEVVISAGTDFDRSALQLCRQLVFSPALGRNGPIPTRLIQSFSFRLR